ncbi:hypothetical protein NBRC13296_12515 [Paenibacillus chitinolyticus]|uniref:hypothetical protein n=1 Tax=Paenibacillus chitinolyticus TaxID=79263 RepID=UPI003558562F
MKMAIRKAAKHYCIARQHGEYVRDYMESIGINDEGDCDAGAIMDWYIDGVEYGQGDANGVIKKLENWLRRNE